MKLAPLYVAFSLGLFLTGCAGSGGGSGDGSGSGLPVAGPDTVIEAVVAPGGSIPADPAAYVYQDTQNIEVNQTVQFQLVSYEGTTRKVLPATEWQTSDTSSAYGTLGINSGLYIAGPVSTPSSFFVGVRYRDKDYFVPYSVKPRQATVIGRILNADTGIAVRSASIEFYNPEGLLVGKAKQPNSGPFRASVPLNATTMVVISESIPSAFRKQYTVNGLGYQAGDITCSTPLPVLGVGNNTLDSDILLQPKTAPEVDLTGCSG
jgi:hypothetical protein